MKESHAEWWMGTESKQVEVQGDTGSWGQEKPDDQNWIPYRDALHRGFSQSLHLEEASIYSGTSLTWSLKLAPLKALRAIHRRPILCLEHYTY